MSSIEILNYNDHKELGLVSDMTYKHAKNHHMTYVLIHEFPQTCINFPIVFVKDSETGQFKSVALFGFDINENVFYTEKQWNTTYIPANIRRAPFLMSPKEGSVTKWSVCIDSESSCLSKDKGERLFNADGSETEQLISVKKFLTDFIERDHLTQDFAKYLSDKNLFKANSIAMNNSDGKDTKINGLYTIDEDKMNELSNEDFLGLKNKGYLGPIYAHLTSLGQIERIMILRNLC